MLIARVSFLWTAYPSAILCGTACRWIPPTVTRPSAHPPTWRTSRPMVRRCNRQACLRLGSRRVSERRTRATLLCLALRVRAGECMALLSPAPHSHPLLPQRCSNGQLMASPQARGCFPPLLPAAPPAPPPRCRQGWGPQLPAVPAAAVRSCCPRPACSSSSGRTAAAGCPAMARLRRSRSAASQPRSAPMAAYQTHSTQPTPPPARALLPRRDAPAPPAASLQPGQTALQAAAAAVA